ncbi:hypothetical protein GGI17_005222 [Coemansia sp. S146]|nr:hypothetical protein GGI17_005222 [Coemansia sp. S146]
MSATNSKGVQALAADAARHTQSAYEAPSILRIVQALVRNAAEASSTKVSVTLAAGGLESITASLIIVSDNGCGIEQNSLKLLAQHGYTSKATSVGCGNALTAVLSVSAQLKICTRTVGEDAATMLILDSNRQVVDRKCVAGNLGTTVTVLQPLSKLPVRYEIAKSQASCGASIVEVKFPNALQPSSTPRTIKHEQLDGVSFEGVFCKPGCEITNESRLPKFGISINGAVCKVDVLPGLLDRLLVAYPTTVRGKADQHFVGILNLVVPPTKLDVSLREPLILRQFEVECIEAAIAEQRVAVRGFSTSSVAYESSVRAGVLLQRDPIVTQPAGKFEEATDRYFDWLQFTSADRFPRDFFFKKGSTAESKWMDQEDVRAGEWFFDAASKPVVKSVKRVIHEDDMIEKSETSKPIVINSRETEADATGNEQSLERKLDRTLYLVVKGAQGEWTLPQGKVNDEELLHEAARRNLKDMCGGKMSVWMVGNGPVGHSKSGEASTFYIKGHILAGQAKANEELASEFKWITREEVEKTVSAEYWLAVKDMLSTI